MNGIHHIRLTGEKFSVLRPVIFKTAVCFFQRRILRLKVIDDAGQETVLLIRLSKQIVLVSGFFRCSLIRKGRRVFQILTQGNIIQISVHVNIRNFCSVVTEGNPVCLPALLRSSALIFSCGRAGFQSLQKCVLPQFIQSSLIAFHDQGFHCIIQCSRCSQIFFVERRIYTDIQTIHIIRPVRCQLRRYCHGGIA